jgi:hypothetical protein
VLILIDVTGFEGLGNSLRRGREEGGRLHGSSRRRRRRRRRRRL